MRTIYSGHCAYRKSKCGLYILIPPFNESTAQYYHDKFMSTLTAKSIWKLGLLAEEKVCKEDNPELRYLIINRFSDINMVINIVYAHLRMEIMLL